MNDSVFSMHLYLNQLCISWSSGNHQIIAPCSFYPQKNPCRRCPQNGMLCEKTSGCFWCEFQTTKTFFVTVPSCYLTACYYRVMLLRILSARHPGTSTSCCLSFQFAISYLIKLKSTNPTQPTQPTNPTNPTNPTQEFAAHLISPGALKTQVFPFRCITPAERFAE